MTGETVKRLWKKLPGWFRACSEFAFFGLVIYAGWIVIGLQSHWLAAGKHLPQ